MANPGAPAGDASGWRQLHLEDVKHRAAMATALAEAIADAHPDDACQLMAAALIDLSESRPPGVHFLTAKEDAEWWAMHAPPAQLCAVLEATLARLHDRALHVAQRKSLFMVLWRKFTPEDQMAFLKKYGEGSQ